MLQIRLLGQFDVHLDGKRIVIPSRAGQSLLAYLALSAGMAHRREKIAGVLWPDTTDENARKNLRHELWRIRKALSSETGSNKAYILADDFSLTFNREIDYWLDAEQLGKTDSDLQSLITNLSLYHGELLPGFYEDWINLERERIQTAFDVRMERLLDQLVEAERWIAVQEWGERWLTLCGVREPAYRALMLASGVRGDVARVASLYQRCTKELDENLGVKPSSETRALYEGLLKGAKVSTHPSKIQLAGTVTFLFADMEDSTRLLEKLGADYTGVLREYQGILRASTRKWNGHEVDVQGDSFFVTFTRATDAIQCAVDVQRAIVTQEWPGDETVRVRMGLHSGESLLTSTGYLGIDVHRAARIGDAGHGGQILLSQTTFELIRNELPTGVTIKEMGDHYLKDLKHPSALYQLVLEDLPSEFPPLRSKFTGLEAPLPGEPPFKGLQYFDESDADLFFGRELVISKLVDRLNHGGYLSIIIGASGSGKSSIARAGLIPALKREESLWDGTRPPEGSAGWQYNIMTPTAHPLVMLATEMTRSSKGVSSTADLMDDLARDPRSLSLFLSRSDHNNTTVLLIDQCEELFTLCRDAFEREAFIDNLLTASTLLLGRFILILTLRADFYSHLAPYPELRDLAAQQQAYIGPMSLDETRRAIEEPAGRGFWEFEQGLVDLILRDVGDEPGALPLLSHALLETWKRRAGNVLTFKGYEEAGGVHGAIAHTAENVYSQFSTAEQAIVRNIFLRLTEYGEGTEDTRRRATFEELTSSEADAGKTRAILNKLAEARLVTMREDSAEVAHEALIREWPQLREWLSDDREGILLHRRLTEATREWELLEHDPGSLYRGARLAQANEWLAQNPKALNSQEKRFLETSNQRQLQEQREREAQQQRELESAQKLAATEKARAEEQARAANRLRIRNRVITTVGSIALILALLAGLFGVQSNRNAAQAESNFNRAEAQRLALEANRLLTAGGSSEQIALLSLRSMNTHYTPEGDAALAAAARLDYPVKSFNQAGPVWSVMFSPDGKYILVGDDNKTVKLWDMQSGQELRQFTGHKARFSPDGKYVLTETFFEGIQMWDADTGQEVYRIATSTKLLYTVYSHDGKTILTSSEDHTVRRWDAASGKEIEVFLEEPEPVRTMAISPDDKYLVTINSTAQLWDLQTGQEIRAFPFDAGRIVRMGFSPDGKFLVSENTDAKVYLWDAKTGQEVRTFTGHTGGLFDMAFSPDSNDLLTSGGDNTVRMWDVDTGQELRRFTFSVEVAGLTFSPDGKWALTGADDGIVRLWAFHPSPALLTLNNGAAVNALDFSPDGKLILTGGSDGAARLWDAVTGEKLRDLVGHTDVINYGAAFSPDGKYLATGSWDAVVRLWDARTGEEVNQFVADTHSVEDVRFSPDGEYLLTAGGDGVRLWVAKTGEEIRQFGEIQSVLRATFSSDGNFVLTGASGSEDGKARLWDASTGKLIREYESALGLMSSVDISPDMKYILGDGTYGNIVHLWDLETGKELRQLVGHTALTYTAVFSPDGKYIATASVDNTARLWDVQTGEELRRFIGHTAAVENVAFSPDSRHILTGSDDGTAMLWDVDYHTTIDYLCSVLLRDFTEEERAQYNIMDQSPTCPNP